MRYFFDNLVGLQPQNLIPEVIWAAGLVYLLTVVGCYLSIIRSNSFPLPSKCLWGAFVTVPFLGPILYASYCIWTHDSGWKEFVVNAKEKTVSRT